MSRIKTSTILQLEAVECGAASLAIVLDYFKRYVPLERLRIDCGVSRNGTNAGNVVRAAKKYGLIGQGIQAEPEDLPGKRCPLIMHWNMNHFVVLEGFNRKGDRVYINDPATGPREITWQELDESFTGIALTFELADEQPALELAEKAGYRQLFKKYFHPPKDVFFFLLLSGLLLVLPGMVMPSLQQIFVDQILQNGRKDWITFFLFLMVGMTVMQLLISGWQKWYLTIWERNLAAANSGKFFWKVLRLPIEFFYQRYAGEIAGRVGIAASVAHLFAGQIVSLILSVFTAVFFLALLFFYNIPLTLLAIVSAALNVLFIFLMSKRNKNISMSLQKDTGKFSAIMASSIKTAETVKAEGGESEVFNRVTGQYALLATTLRTNELNNVFINMVPTVLQSLISSTVLVVGAWMVMYDGFSLGSFMAFQALVGSFYGPVSALAGYAGSFQQITANLNRVDDVMYYPMRDDRYIEPATTEYTGSLSFTGVEFGYSPVEKPLLQQIDFAIDAGKSVALVGVTGCGKSTLLKLCSGLYQPWRGVIAFDDRPFDDWNRDQLFARIGTVDQDSCFFSGTITENITMFDKTTSFEQVVRAAELACIHEHILSMPEGYHTQVLEGGANLSGGQRQRLEIARALCRDVRLLLLDEATSALDTLTEEKIIANIKNLGRTMLVIAHRLSTIRNCDEIIVMRDGTIAERGTHEQLMQQDGFYRQLTSGG
ncbi:MAG: ATP-binding cassette domain-containing protein [Bacillota bacterium]